MKHARLLTATFVLSTILAVSCSAGNEGKVMFTEKIKHLINASNEKDEEIALGQLLVNARETNVNYGYRVFNVTRDKRVMPEDIDNELGDDLLVTIFVGENEPYEEFKWEPKYNGHITRLVMP